MRILILFLQGTRDTLAEIALLEGLVAGLGASVTLLVTPETDHSFHVSGRSGTTDAQVMGGLLDNAVSWMRQIVRAE